MSKKEAPPLHLEWTPGWVRAANVATGDRAEAVTLKKLGQITFGHKEAIVGIGRKIVFLKSVRLPKALPDDLRRIIGVQLGQYFPLPSDQLSFDFIQTANQTQDGFLTIVAAIRADDLRLLNTELKEVGLTAQRVLPISLASSVIAAKSGNVDAVVVEIDRGDIALDVVLQSFIRYSRLAPAGSDLETELKRTLAASGGGIVPVVQVGEPVGDLTAGDNTLRLLDQAPPFQFELAESRSLHAKQRNDARLSIAGLALLVAITIVSVFFVLRQQATAQVHTAQARSLAQIARWQGIEGDDSDQAAQLGQLQSDMTTAFHPGQRLSDISAFVSDSLPKNAWLTGLTLERAKQVQVRGTALSADQVADFVDALGSSPRFANVKLIFANSAVIGTTQVIEFNVTADCVGNLPMPTAPSKEQGNEQTATSSSANSGTGDGG